jgi:hypothetical protein
MTKDIRRHNSYMQEDGSHKVLPATAPYRSNNNYYLYPCDGKLQWCPLREHWWQFTYPHGIMTRTIYNDITREVNVEIDNNVNEARCTRAEVRDIMIKHPYDDRDNLKTFINNHHSSQEIYDEPYITYMDQKVLKSFSHTDQNSKRTYTHPNNESCKTINRKQIKSSIRSQKEKQQQRMHNHKN